MIAGHDDDRTLAELCKAFQSCIDRLQHCELCVGVLGVPGFVRGLGVHVNETRAFRDERVRRDKPGANVRQLDGKPGETWGGESGTNRLVMIQTVAPA